MFLQVFIVYGPLLGHILEHIQNQEKAIIHQNRVFMFIEGDLINHNPNDFGLNQDMRHLPEPKRMRVFIEILNEKMKDTSDSGLKVLHIKNTSSISEKSAIHQMISKTLKLANKYFKNVGELDGALDKTDNFYTKVTTSPKWLKVMYINILNI